MNDKAKAAEVAKILTLTAENFNAELSEARFQMLISELSLLPLEDVRRGMTKLLRTRKFGTFPTLAEILEACGASQTNEQDKIAVEAERQWALALREADRGAPRCFTGWLLDADREPVVDADGKLIPTYEYPTPSGLTPAGKAALRAIGGVGKVGAERWARKDFLEVYCRLASGDAPPQITGQAGPNVQELAAKTFRRMGDGRSSTKPGQAGPRLVRDRGQEKVA